MGSFHNMKFALKAAKQGIGLWFIKKTWNCLLSTLQTRPQSLCLQLVGEETDVAGFLFAPGDEQLFQHVVILAATAT